MEPPSADKQHPQLAGLGRAMTIMLSCGTLRGAAQTLANDSEKHGIAGWRPCHLSLSACLLPLSAWTSSGEPPRKTPSSRSCNALPCFVHLRCARSWPNSPSPRGKLSCHCQPSRAFAVTAASQQLGRSQAARKSGHRSAFQGCFPGTYQKSGRSGCRAHGLRGHSCLEVHWRLCP